MEIVLLTLSYAVCGHSLLKRDIKWLQSPRITPWGKFGPEEFCPMNNFVTGMRLKMDREHIGDNTALNAVQLVCTTMYGEVSKKISSASGRFGKYRKMKYCPSGFATGYHLRSQNGQGNVRDDVAAVDFKLICTDFISGTSSQVIYGRNKFLPWGYWTQERHCPSKTAFCGISTQVEELGKNPRGEDETTLNNVDIACCPIDDPIKVCQLKYNWETMMICPIGNCEIKLSTGIIENEQQFQFMNLYHKLGDVEEFNEFVMNALKVKAEKYSEKINNNSLKFIIGQTKKKKYSFRVKCEGIVQQLVVTCGIIKLYTYKNRCVPNLYAEKEWETKGLYFRPTSRLKHIFWSYNCDFAGESIEIKTSEITDCGDSCFSNRECTHFVWNKYNGGTCWIKGSGAIQTPVEKYDENYICGWIERNQTN